MLPLPRIAIPGPGSFFIRRTAAAISPFTSVVFCHDAFFRVREKTTFCMPFIPSATAGAFARAAGVGQ